MQPMYFNGPAPPTYHPDPINPPPPTTDPKGAGYKKKAQIKNITMIGDIKFCSICQSQT